MKRIPKGRVNRWTVMFLMFLLFGGAFSLSLQADKAGQPLEGLFRWAVMDYQSGKYREVVKNLELMTSYIDEGITKQQKDLKCKTYLLMGAAYEMLKKIDKAKECYRLSILVLEKMEIEGIDLNKLVEYRRVVSDMKPLMEQGVVSKPVFGQASEG